MDNQIWAIVVAAATLVMLGLGAGLILFNRQLAANRLAHAQAGAAFADEILRSSEERDRLSAELKHQVEISAVALDNMAQGLSMYDHEDRLVIVNRRFAELYDIPPSLLEPGTPFDEILAHLLAKGAISQASAFAARSDVEARPDLNRELCLPNGRIILCHRRSLPGGGWVATHEDITDARRANQQIAYLAAHDTLTDLPNRATFAAHLDAYAQSGRPFAVHTIDLDRFKEVNDTLGHAVGDDILKGAATRLRELTGNQDILTRLGGDEFAIIQNCAEGAFTPAELADQIVKRLSEPFQFEGHTIVIGASVGVSLAPQDGANGNELLKMSDLALYCAKNASRGTHRFFEPGMDSRLCARRQLEQDLRVAIREGQFEVHYQPLLDMTHGGISCFEALVRWRHPSKGLVPPADFIATAEDSGLIIPIGEWVLRQACRDAASWPNEVKVAVNVSPAQFKRGDLIAMTMSALSSAGLEPSRLELEITEAVLLHDEEWVRSALQRLAALGVRIAMDDFGTGYSSLSYLRSFPFDKIKIDRSFVADLVGTPDALAIVQATVQLSQKLGMEITAEGVETEEQFEILAAEGCTQVQGYHVSHAVPAGEVQGLLQFYNGQSKTRSRPGG